MSDFCREADIVSSDWLGVTEIEPKSFVCGYCGDKVASKEGYVNSGTYLQAAVYICPGCGRPTYFDRFTQSPPPTLGGPVSSVPPDLERLYGEARVSTGAGAYTGAVLLCRKMLMNIAVQEGAPENRKFFEYVNYLAERGYVPPGGKAWVDHIREKGNEATHEIALMGVDDAAELLGFVEMLLRFIYEFPSKMATKGTSTGV